VKKNSLKGDGKEEIERKNNEIKKRKHEEVG
jgi:hypothetical protein